MRVFVASGRAAVLTPSAPAGPTASTPASPTVGAFPASTVPHVVQFWTAAQQHTAVHIWRLVSRQPQHAQVRRRGATLLQHYCIMGLHS
jgi:hypothetical protein